MANYKVIQDVEDEDKLVGPLTMKQFVYAMIAFLIGLGGWFLGRYTNFYLAAPFFLLTLPFIALALPLRQDQPNDVWLLARLNFLFRPRVRLWSQIGESQGAVKIVADSEKDDGRPGDDRTEEEVEAQVRQLSQLMDSRGHSAVLTESHPARIIDNEHELRHSSLGQRFQRLLHHRKAKRLQGVEQAMMQTLRSQDYYLSQYAPGGRATEQREVPAHLANHLDGVAGVEKMKLSTLESIARKTKAEQGRMRPQGA